MTMIIQIHLKMIVFLLVMVNIVYYSKIIAWCILNLDLFDVYNILVYFDSYYFFSAIYLINHKPKFDADEDLKDAKVNSCLQRVTEILGIALAKDVVAEHLIKNEFNIDRTVDQILNLKTSNINLILYVSCLRINTYIYLSYYCRWC